MQARLNGVPGGLTSDPTLFQQQQHISQNGQHLSSGAGAASTHTLLSLEAAAMGQGVPASFLSPPSSESPAGVTISSPLDLGSLSFTELDEASASALYPDVSLSFMDEGCTMSPERVGDPLFSPLSPGASRSSSRRSSLDMDEDL